MPRKIVIPFGGPAYTKTETRHGPPLSYVAEKLRSALQSLHSMSRPAGGLPTDLPEILNPCPPAFRLAKTSYLALLNQLDLTQEPDFYERVWNLSVTEFERWLDEVDRQGSVR